MPLTFNLPQGTVSFNLPLTAVRSLQTEVQDLLQQFKAAATGEKPGQRSPLKSLEFRHTGTVLLEVFCNPNIYPSPFAAKVLLTIRDEQIRVTTEGELTQLIADLNTYAEQLKA
ncbi:MAG: hypothetical protein AAGG02_00995 [Cyanobacteria bacterium P01_H01_bin.15]